MEGHVHRPVRLLEFGFTNSLEVSFFLDETSHVRQSILDSPTQVKQV